MTVIEALTEIVILFYLVDGYFEWLSGSVYNSLFLHMNLSGFHLAIDYL